MEVNVKIYERHGGKWLDRANGTMIIRQTDNGLTEQVACDCLKGFIQGIWLTRLKATPMPLADIVAGAVFGDLGEIWADGNGEQQDLSHGEI